MVTRPREIPEPEECRQIELNDGIHYYDKFDGHEINEYFQPWEENEEDSEEEEEDDDEQNEEDEDSGEEEEDLEEDGENDNDGSEGQESEGESPEGDLADEAGQEAGEMASEGVADAAGEAVTEAAGEAVTEAAGELALEAGAEVGLTTIGPWALGIIVVFVIILCIILFFFPPPKKPVVSDCTGSTTIVIDPGHPSESSDSKTAADYANDKSKWESSKTGANGGTAAADGTEERLINQKVADLLKTELEAKGYKVIMTKTTVDQFISNRDRGIMARDAKASLIIKIHNDYNAPDPGLYFYTSNERVIKSKWDDKGGFGEYYVRRKPETIAQDKKIAEAMLKAFKENTTKLDIKYANGKPYPSQTIPHSENRAFGYTYDIPTTLIEMSSMMKPADAAFIKNIANQKKLAKAFAEGVSAYAPPGSCGSATGLCKPLKSPDPTSSKGFVQLPQNSKEFNQNGGSPSNQQWGSPELVSMLEAVAQEWNKRHPKEKIMYGDLSLKNGGQFGGHKSHQVGIDVDITSHQNPSFIMTDPNYDKKRAIELAQLFMETKAIVYILYNDTSIHSEVNNYAKSKKLPSAMKSWPSHANHFHLRMDPSAYAKACSFQESAAGKIGDKWLESSGQDLD